MVVVVRVVLTDEERRALRRRNRRPGLATRYEIASLVDTMVRHEVDEALAEMTAFDEARG